MPPAGARIRVMAERAGWQRVPSVSAGARGLWPNRYDFAVFVIVLGAFAAAAAGLAQMARPITQLQANPVVLEVARLPGYALQTTLRMLAAMAASLVFTFIVATLAARSRRAELVIVPALDILQSVPVLGFLSFTVTFFVGLFPTSQLGPELAAIFAIFTSQAWNMAFSFYQSLKTVPADLEEVARHFRLSAWQRFWRLDAPFAVPGLVWNAMMSMSGGWFFVVASEAISVGDTTVTLPGIGSWIALAIDRRDIGAVMQAVGAMLLVILLYDQLLFRPIVAWSEKFRMEQTATQARARSWVLDLVRRSRLVARLGALFARLVALPGALPMPARRGFGRAAPNAARVRLLDRIWQVVVAAATIWAGWMIFAYARDALGPADLADAVLGGLATLARVLVLIVLASLVWVPVGIWIGLRPRLAQAIQPLAQFLAAFPANLLFPILVVLIARYRLDPDIWLSPLMVLGTQWYILFNVIAGASVFPGDLREAAAIAGVRGWLWWRKVALPGVFPYFVTGALTAWGGSWNASIVAEVASWGTTRLEARGLGAYIANATAAGDFHRVVLGIAVMAGFVIVFNRLLWRRLYRVAEARLRMG